jgi:hypothetical protein
MSQDKSNEIPSRAEVRAEFEAEENKMIPSSLCRCVSIAREYIDGNLVEKADCEGCRDWKERFEVLKESKEFWENSAGEWKEAYNRADLRIDILKEVTDQEIASLQNQLTEAQGKRGKVVSVEEISRILSIEIQKKGRNIVIGSLSGWSFIPEEQKKFFDDVATAIHKVVYGEEA